VFFYPDFYALLSKQVIAKYLHPNLILIMDFFSVFDPKSRTKNDNFYKTNIFFQLLGFKNHKEIKTNRKTPAGKQLYVKYFTES